MRQLSSLPSSLDQDLLTLAELKQRLQTQQRACQSGGGAGQAAEQQQDQQGWRQLQAGGQQQQQQQQRLLHDLECLTLAVEWRIGYKR